MPPALIHLPARAAIMLVKAYQRIVSPYLPARCRFVPSCSTYAATAIERWGLCKGGALTLWRLLRCQPLCKGGYDPVPPRQKPDTSTDTA